MGNPGLEEGKTACVPIFVGDDLDSARAEGELEKLTLGVRLVQPCPQGQLTFRFNSRELSLDQARVQRFYKGLVSFTAHRGGLPGRFDTYNWLEFDLPLELVHQGVNQIEVTMDYLFSPLTGQRGSRLLHQVELRIGYKEPIGPHDGRI